MENIKKLKILITAKLPNLIHKTLVSITISCLKFWALDKTVQF